MKTVWKYTLEIKKEQKVSMPIGARILCAQAQFNKPCIWASVDPDKRLEQRTFVLVPTGIEQAIVDTDYIGTCQLDSGQLVLHVFEAKK